MAEYITVREMADIMRIGLNKAYQLVQQSEFPAKKVGHKYLVNKNLLSEWVNKGEIKRA